MRNEVVDLHITADQLSVPMGRTICVEAVARKTGRGSPSDYILLPFVNQRRWGAHERPDAEGRACFLLPLPNPGPAHVQIVALKSDTVHWMGLNRHRDMLLVGRPMPQDGARSNVVEVNVRSRAILPHKPDDTLFCMQWEPWFTGGIDRWQTAQAVPLFGFYDSYNRDVTRQQMLWFMDLGVDCLLADWTNHLWGKTHWNQRSGHVNTLVHATTLALETLAALRDEGLPVPKMVLFPGLSNGRPTTMAALNEELDWVYHNYLRNPRFDGLWQDFDGKPLIVVLDTGAVGDKRGTAESAFRIPFFEDTLEMSAAELDAFRAVQPPVDDAHFTVRWMSSQNQATRHHELGYWSWMDGTIDPPVTVKDGIAEAVTVTPSYFNALGWTGPLARGRLGGTTYVETFKVAMAHRLRIVFLHQWQEYSGQREGDGRGPDRNLYTDTYSVELSDDLEPVSLTAPGSRGDRGGWGFYDLNLTQALMALYRGQAEGCTILAVGSPLRHAVVTGDVLSVSWSIIGEPVVYFSIALDGQAVKEKITGNTAEIPLTGLPDGLHTVTVIAEGAITRFPLSRTALDTPLDAPVLVRVDVLFVI